MDLGLSALSDDQAIGLLQEVLSELATRDPVVRRLAQQQIVSESQKLDIAKEALKNALDSAKKDYEACIGKEIGDEVKAAVRDGKIRLMDSSEEGLAVVRAQQSAMKEMLEAAKKAIPKCKTYDVYLMINSSRMEIKVGSQRQMLNHEITDHEASILINAFQRCFDEATKDFFKP